MGLFESFKIGLLKTRTATLGKLGSLLRGGNVDETTLIKLEEALLEADLGVSAVDQIISNLRRKLSEGGRNGAPIATLKQDLTTLLQTVPPRRGERFNVKPWVILVAGVNGSGKTTTIGKLAYHFHRQGRRTVIAAADTFRAAASEQLEVWARRADARFITQQPGADPAAVAFDALQSARARGEDLLLIDTAGRLQTKHNLMQELTKISRVLKKQDPSTPHEVLLVIDATTGQNGLSQARAFGAVSGITGLVITKLDGTARGGIVVPICRELTLPVEFVGFGEGIEDLQPFDPELYAAALLEE